MQVLTSAWCSSFCCRTSMHSSARCMMSSSFFFGVTSSPSISAHSNNPNLHTFWLAQPFCSQQQPQLTLVLACSTLLLTATTPTYTPSGLLNPSAHSNNHNLHSFWLAQAFCSQQQPQLIHILACSTPLLTAITPTYTRSGLLNPSAHSNNPNLRSGLLNPSAHSNNPNLCSGSLNPSAHSNNPNLPFPIRSINPNPPFPIKLERTQDDKIQLLIRSQNRISSRIRMQILNEQFKDSAHTIQNIC